MKEESETVAPWEGVLEAEEDVRSPRSRVLDSSPMQPVLRGGAEAIRQELSPRGSPDQAAASR